MGRTMTVEAEVDVADVLENMSDQELAELNLYRAANEGGGVDAQLRLLAEAVRSGNEAERDRLIEELCWDVVGVNAYRP